jgi:hypothetical protein
LYQHVIYKPSGGNALVKSGSYHVYTSGAYDSLIAAVDTYLVDITWVLMMTWKNDTDATQTYPYTFTTGLTITKGIEINKGFPLGPTYKGATLTIDHKTRVFKPTETTEAKTITINLSVPPQSLIVVYQRKYKFKDSMFFVHQSSGGQFGVALQRGEGPCKKECEVEIMSEDYATLRAELSGTGTIDVDTVGRAQATNQTTFKDNCTWTCRNKLNEMGI